MADFVHVDSPVAFDSEPQPLPTQDPLGNSSIPQDPNTAQHDYLKFLKTHPFVRSSVIDKAYGCIIGSALGDTIGLYTEFLPKATCAEVYEKKKFTLVGEATEWYGDSHRCKPCSPDPPITTSLPQISVFVPPETITHCAQHASNVAHGPTIQIKPF